MQRLRRDGWGRYWNQEGQETDSKGNVKNMAKKGTPLNKRGPKKPTGGKQSTGKKKGK